MTAFEKRVEKAVAIDSRLGGRAPEGAKASPRLGEVAWVAAAHSPIGLAVVENREIRWSNSAFRESVGDLAGAVADRAQDLRTGQPVSLASLFDVGPVDPHSDVLLYIEPNESFSVVAAVCVSSDRSNDDGSAGTDADPDLPGRPEMEAALEELGRNAIEMMLVAVDGFDELDRCHGTGASHVISTEVSRRLLGAARSADRVFGLGPGQFVVLGRELSAADDESGNAISRRLTRAVSSKPIVFGHAEVPVAVNTSLGCADPTADPLDVVEQIEKAMPVTSPAGGGNQAAAFSRVADSITEEEKQREVQKALEAHRFRLLYQPVVVLGTGEIVGQEALLRLVIRDHLALAPSEFFDHARAAGMMEATGEWVLARAIDDLASGVFDEGQRMCVNLFPSQFASNTLPSQVEHLIRVFDVDPELLVLEFTEAAILSDPDAVAAQLRQLVAIGVRIAIDDFGTGHSSLTHLADLPIDVIKIDKRFVDQIETQEGEIVAKVVIGVGDILGCDIIAEGIERNEQVLALMRLGCHYGQGYHLGHPTPLSALGPEDRGAPRSRWG